MAIQPDDFDVPVVDYTFNESVTPRGLLDQMANAGGFTATKLAVARDILLDMKSQLDVVTYDSKVCNWLSFPACLCATELVVSSWSHSSEKMFNVVSTTCGMLDHDIARSHKHYYHGAFELDDRELENIPQCV